MKNEKLMEKGYEGLVFYARHWEIAEWLDEHWKTDEGEEVTEAARNAKLGPEVVDRIKSLVEGENATDLWSLLWDTAPTQAAKLIETTLAAARDILGAVQCQCEAAKRLTSRSDWWESDFEVRPKHMEATGVFMSFGARVDFATAGASGEGKGVATPCLTTWFWLKPKTAVSHAITIKDLKKLSTNHSALDKAYLATRPKLFFLAAVPILSYADTEFRLDANGLVDACVAPLEKLTRAELDQLYRAAGGKL